MAGDSYVVLVQSAALESLKLDDTKIAANLSRAINKTIRRARTAASRAMREQVNFKAGYLSGSAGQLTITQQASTSDLAAVITGRARATSLGRFARGARKNGQAGVRVEVSPGSARFLPRAFFVNLRSGGDGSLNNRGVAIRLPEGVRPNRAYRPKRMGPNLWLLYGPSVDQVFDDVAEDIAPETADYLESEFLRLTDVDL